MVLNIFKESTVLGKIENIEKTNIEKYYPKYGYNIFFQPSWNSENPLERIICKRTFVYEVYEFSTMNRIATFCSETNLFKEKFGAKYQLQKTLSGKELFKFFDNKFSIHSSSLSSINEISLSKAISNFIGLEFLI